ncbi:MAG: hypothetical protein PPHEINF_4828 [uncultured Paraburkholderia sp.]|nr:MAG: hypothetical protein PPHEESC_1907 [uncultured Paraburkholderia sp.]CAH2799658.1 MAG: hypothetical protein PPHEINF_4828 [uncultured Paraburkholderia sp.]CAH2916103.1 MAG: hypothetical protein PPHERAN_1385 [uncultured Paraburkholderia sp.]
MDWNEAYISMMWDCMKYTTASGEQGESAINTGAIAFVDGKSDLTEAAPLMERLNDRELMEWSAHQKPNENGAINLMDWPGWGDAALRRFADQARNYRPNIQTVSRLFVQLVVGEPASGKSVMMNTFPVTDPAAPESKEDN